MKPNGKYFHYPRPTIDPKERGLEKWGNGKLVTFPVSCTYNGGIILNENGVPDENGEWYDGYIVPPPVVPEGYELHSIHCSLQLNCHPPYATRQIVKI